METGTCTRAETVYLRISEGVIRLAHLASDLSKERMCFLLTCIYQCESTEQLL